MPVINVDPNSMFALEYNAPVNPDVINYVRQQSTTFMSQVNAGAQTLFNQAVAGIANVIDGSVFRHVSAAIAKTLSIWDTNAILPITTYTELQNAPDVMLPYLMANPIVQTAYNDGILHGYGTRYESTSPTVIGLLNEHYASVVHGVAITGDDATTLGLDADKTYLHWVVHSEPRVELSLHEQSTILDAWSLQRLTIDAGRDPTDDFDQVINFKA